MTANYYTLFHIAKELNQEFAGKTVNEIFTQHRGELVLSFNETSAVIIVGCEPSDNFIYMRNAFARARRNSTDLFPEIFGKVVTQIRLHDADRQIQLRFQEEKEIIIQIFGSKANVILVDEKKRVPDSFLKKEHINIQDNKESVRLNILPTVDQLKSFDENQTVHATVKKALTHFGSVLQQELISRSGIPAEGFLRDCTEKELGRIVSTAENMRDELIMRPSIRIYYKEEMPVRFSLIPLQQYEEFRFREFDSISEAIQTYRSQIFHEKSFLQEKDVIVQVLLREHSHIEKTLQKISDETQQVNLPEQCEKFGKLITANIHIIKKGEKTAIVEDVLTGSSEVLEIPLDPHLNPSKNAERYFEKAKKTKTAIEERQKRLADLSQKQSNLTRLLDHLDEATTGETLQRFIDEYGNELKQFGFKQKKAGHVEKEEPIPFRVFIVDGGFQAWAGKSGENNDLLSTRHTAKNDLWFHARGVGGSHVVLKVGTGKGEVSKRAIEQAAGIAAYYSKMKGSKLVAVSLCEGKYVRKPKGVPAGTVTIEREKTIFAEPGLPDN
jgi:predicted ribosome quality control (RQC) complex YloA/Tae2 family protein